jgi:uncharacterized protein
VSWFRWDAGDLLLNVKLQPGASRNEYAGLQGDALRIRIHAPAIKGRANEALVTFLSASFAVSNSRIRIERGALGRVKLLRIQIPGQLPAELVASGITIPTK